MKPNIISTLVGVLCVFSSLSQVSAQVTVVQTITKDLGIPWGMVSLDKNKLLVTQRDGQVMLVDRISGQHQPVSGAPKVLAKGQGGLLDVKKSPNYAQDSWLYFTYVKKVDGQGATTLARAKLVDSTLSQWTDLLVTQSRTKYSRHYGSRIAFDLSGHVYFSVGDRGVRNNAQDLSTHAGSILRLNLDGSIPEDNPFVAQKGALAAIYSYGHRNPQGLAFDAKTKQLWAIEHGPRGGDELNLIKSGLNYGWPIVSHGREYMLPIAVGEATTKVGYQDPVQVYIPSIAPSSLALTMSANASMTTFYIGALKLTHLNRLVVNESKTNDEQRFLEKLGSRIRNVITDGDKHLLVATDDGQILRVAI